jgi:molecular chaperone DnaK (HSP70)
MSNAPPIDEVIGFDLGHGESAVAGLSLTPKATPLTIPINTRNSQITAVGKYRGATVIGEVVIRSLGVTDVRVGFKLQPPGTPESRQAIVDFVRYYHDTLTKMGHQRAHYFVGCPSGWTADEIDDYQKLLETVLPNVTVVRESRAALIQAKEEGKVSPERLRSSILVIDFGSSTVDVSHIRGGIQDQSLDAGMELGGHLIEKEILRRAIERSRSRSEIEAWFAAHPDERRVAELFCREVKERYWAMEATAATEQRKTYLPIGNDGLFLEVFLDPAEVDRVLNAALPELGGVSWKQALHRFLDDVQSQLKTRGATPAVLVLTGGPSKMSFVAGAARNQFPGAEFVWCTPPEEAVAMGLARWGGIQLRTTAFSEEVGELCRSSVPSIVSTHMETLKTRLASHIAEGLADNVIAAAAREWRSGTIRSLDGMQQAVIKRAGEWIRGSSSNAAIHRAYEPVLDVINREVNQTTYDLCMKHGVPHGSLRIDLNVPVGDAKFDVALGPFEAVVSAAALVVGAVLFVLTGIAKAALATATLEAGPPGWLVAGLVAAWASIFGLSILDEKLKSADLPVGVREAFLSDSRLAKLTREATTALEEKVSAAFGTAEMETIRDAVIKQVSDFLSSRAEEVKWIIAPPSSR